MSNFSFTFTLLKILNNSPILQYFVFFKESQFKDWEEMQTHQAQLHAEAQTGISIRVSHAIQHRQPATSHSCEELCLGKWWKSKSKPEHRVHTKCGKAVVFLYGQAWLWKNFKRQWLISVFYPFQAQQQPRTQDLCYSSDKDE